MIAVDLDGVLAEFSEAFSRLVSERYGTPILRSDQVPSWDWNGVLTKEQMDYGWDAVRSSDTFWGSLAPLAPSSVFATLASYQKAIPIVFITSRIGRHVYDQSAMWLERMGIENPLLVVVPEGWSKASITRDWPLTAVIEDAPEQALALAENDTWVYLVGYLYNRNVRHANIIRCKDTEDALARAIKLWQVEG